MKTLLININKEHLSNGDDLIVVDYDIDGDFLYHLGGKIAEGCKIENVIRLITDFNVLDNQEYYGQLMAQWYKLKNILFSEQCVGEYKIELPQNYLRWMRFHPQYVSIYDKNFSHGEPTVITIDLEKLYEISVKRLQNRIFLKLYRDDLYSEIDGIVFNDDAVTRVSPIVRAIKEKYEDIRFKSYKKWIQSRVTNGGATSSEPKIDSNQQNIESPEAVLFEEQSWGWQTVRYFDSHLILKRHLRKYGLVDYNGRVILPCEYDEIQELKSKFIRLYKDGKYGIISNNKTTNVPCVYDVIHDCEDGLFRVQEGALLFKIDSNGMKRYLKQGKYWLYTNADGSVNSDWMCIVSPLPNVILGQSELSILDEDVDFVTFTQNGQEQMKGYLYKVNGNMDMAVIQLQNDTHVSKLIISSATCEYDNVKKAVQRFCSNPILNNGRKSIYQTSDKTLKILITDTQIIVEHYKTSVKFIDVYQNKFFQL